MCVHDCVYARESVNAPDTGVIVCAYVYCCVYMYNCAYINIDALTMYVHLCIIMPAYMYIDTQMYV
jgi:hypothetical protein